MAVNLGILALEEVEHVMRHMNSSVGIRVFQLCEGNLTVEQLRNFDPEPSWKAVILFHSVNAMRLALTDVCDAKYDTLMPILHRFHARSFHTGVCVIVFGVKNDDDDVRNNLRNHQPSLFQHSSGNVFICTKLDEMRREDYDSITHFLKEVYNENTTGILAALRIGLWCLWRWWHYHWLSSRRWLRGITIRQINVHQKDPQPTHEEADSEKQQILLEDGRIVVTIPPGEPKDGRKVIVETISAITADLPLKHDEVVISTGLRFLPSGTKFDKPVKVTMPHCAFFRKLDKAKIKLYSRKIDGSNDVKTITSVANQIPRCDIREKDLDLYIDHFSDWWIISVTENYFIGIRLVCTPYIPVSLCMDGQDRIYLNLRKKFEITEEPIRGCEIGGQCKEYFIKWRHGPVIISCLCGDTELPEKTLEEEKLHYLTQDFVTFSLNLREATGGRIAGEFFLKQSIETMIPFYLHLPGPNPATPLGSTASSAVGVRTSSVDVSSTDMPSTSHGSGRATVSLSTRSPSRSSSQQQGCTDPVTDELLTRLSKKIPHKKYIEVSEKLLPDDYNRVMNILRKNCDDYEAATRECLGMWKDRTGGSLAELCGILEVVELGGLRYLFTNLTSTEYERGSQRSPNISFFCACLLPMVLLLLCTIYYWYKSL